MAISKRSSERAISGLKRLIPVMQAQKEHGVSEADTVTLVKDVMAEVFGFDKYVELESEHGIKGTYCDLAVKVDEKLLELVEVKSAGTALVERHVKQAIDYAANKGLDWVVLTNGSVWQLYNVLFGKPIDKRLLIEIDLSALELKGEACVDCLAPFMKEGFAKGVQDELRDRQDAKSKYLLAALILNNAPIMARIRRELRKVVDVLVDDEEIRKVLRDDVIKPGTLEGSEADIAAKKVKKAQNLAAKETITEEAKDDAANDPVITPTV